MNSNRSNGLAWWSAATIFVSAFLLFQVQPVITKKILPWFGGSPAVWTTCVLFFQLVLLGGYAYAHLVTHQVQTKWQAIVHLGIVLLAVLMLPIVPRRLVEAGGWIVAGAANFGAAGRGGRRARISCFRRRGRWCKRGLPSFIRGGRRIGLFAVEYRLAGGAAYVSVLCRDDVARKHAGLCVVAGLYRLRGADWHVGPLVVEDARSIGRARCRESADRDRGVVGDMDTMLRRLIGEDIDLVTAFGSTLASVEADPARSSR